MEKQPMGGVYTHISRDPELQKTEILAVLMLSLGAAHAGVSKLITDEATFWREYLSSITIGDVTIPLGPKCLPDPVTLAEKLAEDPNSDEKLLNRLLSWVDTVASPQQIFALLNKIEQKCLKLN